MQSFKFRRWMLSGCFALAATSVNAQREQGAPVKLEGNTLFRISARQGPFSPEDRARAASSHLLVVAKDLSLPVGNITTVPMDRSTNIVLGDEVLLAITDEDARLANVPRNVLAATYVERIRSAIQHRRDDYNWRAISIRVVYSVATTGLLVLVLWGLRKIFPPLYRRVAANRSGTNRALHVQHAELISAQRMTRILLRSLTGVRVVLTLLLLYLYLTVQTSFFPLTRDYTPALVSYLLTPLQAVGSGFIGYLPSLLVIVVMGVFAFACIRISRFVFHHVATGAISWHGFYAEWAQATHKIVRFLILAFTAVVVFPYLPGSNSPAFRGISIFLGVLFSLGSTSAIANVIAGVILTYTRAFKIGDRVKIADTIGDVMETTFLATRVQTIKNELVTVPNSMVLGAHIINFTSHSGEPRTLILHTSVTIGYDAPWRTVHDLLIAAALRTNEILPEPRPFVLQTALNDFFVQYEINGYTNTPANMVNIYGELHQNIQDCFNEAGVEIMSPHYSSLRDGNRKAIPDDYLPKNYEAPRFRTGDRSRAASGS